MLRTNLMFLFVLATVALAALPADAADKKTGKDPDWIEMSILKGGKPVGDLGFKTVSTATGMSYTSSKMEMKGKKGALAIQTHVERDKDGKVVKYRKWVGNQGADPDVIAFWKDKGLRIVSKVPKHRFTNDLKPEAGFVPVDKLGFHLYSFIAAAWVAGKPESLPCVYVDRGTTGKLTLKAAGSAVLKNGANEDVQAEAAEVASDKVTVTMFVGTKPVFLGFQSKSTLVLRKGWSLVSVSNEALPPPTEEVKKVEGEGAAPEATADSGEKKVEEKKAEEKKVEEKKVEEKKVETDPHPPLPE